LLRLHDSAGAHPISTTALCLARTGSKLFDVGQW